MRRVPVEEARKHLAGWIDHVAAGGHRVILCRRGQEVAALVPLADLDRLRRFEDLRDVRAAREAEADAEAKKEKPIPWDVIRRRLGL